MDNPKVDKVFHDLLDFLACLVGIFYFSRNSIEFSSAKLIKKSFIKFQSLPSLKSILMFLKQVIHVEGQLVVVFLAQFDGIALIGCLLIAHDVWTEFCDLELPVIFVDQV